MLKGLAITPVVLGRIAIGEVVQKGDKRLPKKADHFKVQSLVQKNGEWVPHPVAEQFDGNEKLRRIPVRIMFDKPSNNFSAEYSAFDQKGRQLCVGDGEKAKRRNPDGSISEEACPGSDHCLFGKANRCKSFARLLVGMESTWKDDPLSGFIFRTTSFNSIRTISARLEQYHAVSGGKMAGMPCDLVLRAKTTAASMRQAIFYIDLEPKGGLCEAIQEAMHFHRDWEEVGLQRDALEQAVHLGLTSSAFKESVEDGEEVVDEFFNPNGSIEDDAVDSTPNPRSSGNGENATGANGTSEASEMLISEVELKALETALEERNNSLEEGKTALLRWLGMPDGKLEQLTQAQYHRAMKAMSAEKEKERMKAESQAAA